jgi:hypothetical protein
MTSHIGGASTDGTDDWPPMTEQDWLEFEIDFIACTFMFKPGMTYEEARQKAIEEWRLARSDG